MKGIHKIALVVSKIMEILHWVGAAFLTVLFVFSLFAKNLLYGLYEKGIITVSPDSGADTGGLAWELVDKAGNLNMAALSWFCVGAIITMILFAMVFRNLYLVIRNSKDTPFKPDNVRMIREIGIFTIAEPAIGLIISIAARIALGHDNIELSVNLDGFVTGILVLFLTQVFLRGVELQDDVDGLL